jgi:hypothetical protein
LIIDTINGNDVDFQQSDLSNIQSISTESLVIGGTLYEEDDNSPFVASNETPATYQLAEPSPDVILLPDRDNPCGHDQIRVNGFTSTDYDVVDNSDATSTGLGQWNLSNPFRDFQSLQINNLLGNTMRLSTQIMNAATGMTVGGIYSADASDVSQITIDRSDGNLSDSRLRVYRRDI